RIGRRTAGRAARAFLLVFLLLLQLSQFGQRLLEALLSLAGRPFTGRLVPGVAGGGLGFVVAFPAHLLHPLLRLLPTFLQRLLPPERTAARVGPDPHAVLSDRLERDQSLMH